MPQEGGVRGGRGLCVCSALCPVGSALRAWEVDGVWTLAVRNQDETPEKPGRPGSDKSTEPGEGV